jgi:hypothetical protein
MAKYQEHFAVTYVEAVNVALSSAMGVPPKITCSESNCFATFWSLFFQIVLGHLLSASLFHLIQNQNSDFSTLYPNSVTPKKHPTSIFVMSQLRSM